MDLATQRRLIERYDADYVYEEEVWEEVSGVSVLILLDLIQFVCWFPLSGRGQAGHSSNLSVFAPSFTRHLFPLFQIYCPKIPHFRQIPLSTWVWLQIGYPKTTNVLSSFSPFLMTVLRFGQIFFRATGTRPSKLNFKKIGTFESYQVTWGFPIKNVHQLSVHVPHPNDSPIAARARQGHPDTAWCGWGANGNLWDGRSCGDWTHQWANNTY